MRLNKPSPRLAILRAQLAAKAADEAFDRALYSYSAQNPRTLRALPPLADSLPLPPDYWSELERWTKTLAPAKPAADKPSAPATQPAQKAITHSVCIKAYVGATGFHYEVGYVCPVPFDEIQRIRGDKKQHWLPCDESGWVTHVPTADALCPVPASVEFEYMVKTVSGKFFACGSGGRGDCNFLNWDMDTPIIAWRPIAQS